MSQIESDEALQMIEESDCDKYLPVESGTRVKILRAADGDTIVIAFHRADDVMKLTARLRGIDTPEIGSLDSTERLMAMAARRRLAEKAENQIATVLDAGVDKYGRVLCNMTIDGDVSLSTFMLENETLCRPYTGGVKLAWTFTEEEVAAIERTEAEDATPVPPVSTPDLSTSTKSVPHSPRRGTQGGYSPKRARKQARSPCNAHDGRKVEDSEGIDGREHDTTDGRYDSEEV